MPTFRNSSNVTVYLVVRKTQQELANLVNAETIINEAKKVKKGNYILLPRGFQNVLNGERRVYSGTHTAFSPTHITGLDIITN